MATDERHRQSSEDWQGGTFDRGTMAAFATAIFLAVSATLGADRWVDSRVSDRLTPVDRRVEQATTELNELQTKINEQRSKLIILKRDVSELGDRVETLDTDVEELEE